MEDEYMRPVDEIPSLLEYWHEFEEAHEKVWSFLKDPSTESEDIFKNYINAVSHVVASYGSNEQRITWELVWLLYHDGNAVRVNEKELQFRNFADVQVADTGCFMQLMNRDPFLKHIRRVIHWLEIIAANTHFEDMDHLRAALCEFEDSGLLPKYTFDKNGRSNVKIPLDFDGPHRERVGLCYPDNECIESLMQYVWMLLRQGNLHEAQIFCRKVLQHHRAANLDPISPLFMQFDAERDPATPFFLSSNSWFFDDSLVTGSEPKYKAMKPQLFWAHQNACAGLAEHCCNKPEGDQLYEAAVYSVIAGSSKFATKICGKPTPEGIDHYWEDSLWLLLRELLTTEICSVMKKTVNNSSSRLKLEEIMLKLAGRGCNDGNVASLYRKIQHCIILGDLSALFSTLQEICGYNEELCFVCGELVIIFKFLAAKYEIPISLGASRAACVVIQRYIQVLTKDEAWPFHEVSEASVFERQFMQLHFVPVLISLMSCTHPVESEGRRDNTVIAQEVSRTLIKYLSDHVSTIPEYQGAEGLTIEDLKGFQDQLMQQVQSRIQPDFLKHSTDQAAAILTATKDSGAHVGRNAKAMKHVLELLGKNHQWSDFFSHGNKVVASLAQYGGNNGEVAEIVGFLSSQLEGFKQDADRHEIEKLEVWCLWKEIYEPHTGSIAVFKRTERSDILFENGFKALENMKAFLETRREWKNWKDQPTVVALQRNVVGAIFDYINVCLDMIREEKNFKQDHQVCKRMMDIAIITANSKDCLFEILSVDEKRKLLNLLGNSSQIQ